MAEKITKEMTLSDILDKVPDASEVFDLFGLHCANCVFNEHESLLAGAMGHGLEEEEVDEMVEEINQMIEKNDG